MSQIKAIAHDSWNRLYPWLKQNGIEGYDPYIIREIPFYHWLTRWPQFLPLKLIRFPLIRFIEFYPSLWIKLLHLSPSVINKGVALLASSYLSSYRATADKTYLEDADLCFDWLLKHPSPGYSGLGWGYPFDWQSVNFIPKGTPSSVVSTHVGHAFWERYQILGQTSDLDVCLSICDFLMNDLHCHEVSADEVCFSYTPIDSTHILNASLFTSEFLIRVGNATQNIKWIEFGKRGVKYVLNNQQEDGSFWYYGKEDEGRFSISSRTFKKVDAYHTGFVLRMLSGANRIMKSNDIDLAIEKGLEYYIKHFIDLDRGTPYTNIDLNRNKINIHGCAESLLILNRFSQTEANLDNILIKVLNWIIKNMQDPSGYFYYEKTPFITKKIAYVRWGQAWMARALSDIIEKRKENTS